MKKEKINNNNGDYLPAFRNGALQNGSDESDSDMTRSSLLFTFDIPAAKKNVFVFFCTSY